MKINMFKKFLIVNVIFICIFISNHSYSNEKFVVKGDTLFYNSDLSKQEIDREITFLDV